VTYHLQVLEEQATTLAMRKILSNIHLRTFVVISTYVLLYFMYAENTAIEPKARSFGFMINANQSIMLITFGWLTLQWYYEANNRSHKTLFFSFSMFCLIRLFYRFYVLIIDGSLVSMHPQYFFMLFIVGVLVLIERRWV
jgi:hypothetical protein